MRRARLKAIASRCSDPATVDALDRILKRGKVGKASLKRVARRCSDFETTDALDALLIR